LAGKSDSALTRHFPQQPLLKLETVYFRRAKPMKTRIMYIECKGNEISGPARIGRVTFSKSDKSLYYQGRRFHTLSGGGFKANYFDCETGEH